MAAKRHERTYARKQAIQILYQSEILAVPAAQLLDDAASFIDGARPAAYAASLVSGVDAHVKPIDAILERYSENWAVERMPSLDRAILRLAAFEMAHVDEVPISVTINEAVELAKEFGGEDESPRFVNGVLGRIAEYLEEHGCLPGEEPSVQEAADAQPEPQSDAQATPEAADEDEAETAPTDERGE